MLYASYNALEAGMKLEIKKIGNSTGLILPKELLTELNLKQGQWVYATRMPDGGVRLSPTNPDFEKTMEVMDDLMVEYRDTLKTLAK
jgi:putative addiction module antidote